MSNALLILIVLAVVLLLVSLVISKSSLPDADKITSLILILLVFSLVAILNESKRAQNATKTLPSSFYNATTGDFPVKNAKNIEKLLYQPPKSLANFKETPGFFAIEREISQDLQTFLVIFAEKPVGKTNELLGITKKNVEEGRPTLYFDCEHREFPLEKLLKWLQIENLAVLEETVEKLNKIQRVPLVILDNFKETREFCEICGVFAYFFEKTRVNFVVATNDFATLRMLEKNRFLRGILQRKDVCLEKSQVLQIIREFNEKSGNNSREIQENQAIFCENLGVFDYVLLQKYQENREKIEDFQEFCLRILKEELEEITDFSRFRPLFQGFLRISLEKHGKIVNEFVSYSELRALKLENFALLLEEAVEIAYFESFNGKYRVRSQALFNALANFLEI